MHTEILAGNLIEFDGIGVHILGKSGSGKSTLTYQLISKGHRFISDDVTLYQLNKSNKIIGKADKNFFGKLYLPQKGILNMEEEFGKSSIKLSSKLEVIINLDANNKQDLHHFENRPKISYRLVLGKKVPELTLSHQANTCKVTFIENQLKNFINL